MRNKNLLFGCSLALLTACCVFASSRMHTNLGISGASQSGVPSHAAVRESVVEVRPGTLDLGRVQSTNSIRRTVTLYNPQDVPVGVTNIAVSCDCVSINPPGFLLAPGGSTDLDVIFNPSLEPEFRGKLALEISGFSRPGVQVFGFKVNVFFD